MSRLRIEGFVLGQVATNTYLAMEEETKKLFLVDPADRADLLTAKIEDMGGIPEAVLLTHGHFDHIGAVEELKEKYRIPVYAMAEETEVLASESLNLSGMFGCPITIRETVPLKDKEHICLAGREIVVFHTPGHTQGGACYYLSEDGVLFSGDTLFCESVGRSDFPTGSMSVLVRSIKEKLMALPEDTRVLPGHNGETTIGHEKRYNPFL